MPRIESEMPLPAELIVVFFPREVDLRPIIHLLPQVAGVLLHRHDPNGTPVGVPFMRSSNEGHTWGVGEGIILLRPLSSILEVGITKSSRKGSTTWWQMCQRRFVSLMIDTSSGRKGLTTWRPASCQSLQSSKLRCPCSQSLSSPFWSPSSPCDCISYQLIVTNNKDRQP